MSVKKLAIEDKLRELAEKHEIPADLLIEAVKLERQKVHLSKRRITPKLVEMIETHVEQ